MKITFFIAIAVALLSMECPAQDKMPMLLRTARSKYDAAVKTVVDPIRLRYLEELNRMRSTAMSQKNLDLANAIDEEITNVSAETGRTPDRLGTLLVGTSWGWGKNADAPTSMLRFTAGRGYQINNDAPGNFTVSDGNSIRFDNGTVLKFDRELRSYDGTTSNGETRAGKKR